MKVDDGKKGWARLGEVDQRTSYEPDGWMECLGRGERPRRQEGMDMGHCSVT